MNDSAEVNFQNWYFKTVSDTDAFLSNSKFFSEFTYQYRLRGICKAYLDNLSARKKRISELIKDDDLNALYLEHFHQSSTRKTGKTNQKVFFTKLVHTFRPSDYCVIDKNIRDYFGLQECFKLEKSDFVAAYRAISRGYKEWATEKQDLIQELRKVVAQVDTSKIFKESMTALKLLDLVFLKEAKKPSEMQARNHLSSSSENDNFKPITPRPKNP